MARRKICPEERLKQLEDNLAREIQEWEYIHEYGCQDPFWPDGANLCLCRCVVIPCLRKSTIIIWGSSWPVSRSVVESEVPIY